jgi:glycyl-tRNA synthetase beta subunit
MPSIQTTNISTAVAQTAHPSSNSAVRAAVNSTSPTQLALASQQAAAITAVAAREDAVRIVKNPKRVEGIFGVQKDKSEEESDAESPAENNDSKEGSSDGPVRKKLSLRV